MNRPHLIYAILISTLLSNASVANTAERTAQPTPAAESGNDGIPIPTPSGWSFRRLRDVLIASRANTVASFLTAVQAADPKLFSYSAFVYATGSEQDASLQNPRVIVYGSDANLILTFNGDPAQAGYASVETMEFNRWSGYTLREIYFPQDHQQPTVREDELVEDLVYARISAKNPSTCTMCHNAAPLPILFGYPRWVGFYGSEEERLTPAEVSAAIANEPYWQSHVRYSKAMAQRDPPGEPAWLYNDPAINPNDSEPSWMAGLPKAPGWTFKRNGSLNDRISWQLSQVLMDDVGKRGRDALNRLGRAVNCSYSSIFDFSGSVFGDLAGRQLQAWFDEYESDVGKTDGFGRGAGSIAAVYAALKSMGLSIRNYSWLSPKGNNFHEGLEGYPYLPLLLRRSGYRFYASPTPGGIPWDWCQQANKGTIRILEAQEKAAGLLSQRPK